MCVRSVAAVVLPRARDDAVRVGARRALPLARVDRAGALCRVVSCVISCCVASSSASAGWTVATRCANQGRTDVAPFSRRLCRSRPGVLCQCVALVRPAHSHAKAAVVACALLVVRTKQTKQPWKMALPRNAYPNSTSRAAVRHRHPNDHGHHTAPKRVAHLNPRGPRSAIVTRTTLVITLPQNACPTSTLARRGPPSSPERPWSSHCPKTRAPL